MTNSKKLFEEVEPVFQEQEEASTERKPIFKEQEKARAERKPLFEEDETPKQDAAHTIVCDTREKKNEHVLQYFREHDIPYVIQKLDTGDYVAMPPTGVVIDRKQNLGELLGNMCSSDKNRFWSEIRRSKDIGVKLIILCEHGGKFKSIKDVANYKSKYSKVSGRELMERMYAAHIAYGVEFLFCSKKSTGRRIVELLCADQGATDDA